MNILCNICMHECKYCVIVKKINFYLVNNNITIIYQQHQTRRINDKSIVMCKIDILIKYNGIAIKILVLVMLFLFLNFITLCIFLYYHLIINVICSDIFL